MKPFTKKQNIIFLLLSATFLLLSILPILFSNNLLFIIQDFLEQYIFHDSIDMSKKATTINALIAIPIFFVIFADVILFMRFSNKSKIILLCFYAGLFLICTGIVTSFSSYNFADSDLISELLLGKECYLSKSFWPTSWNYSTEIRIINTQLVTAPLFFFTSNLHLIKTLSVILLLPFLPLSLYFLLNELRIQELWMKFLACLLILCPSSIMLWKFVHFGSYYIPHICIAFSFLGLFYGLVYNDYSKKRRRIYLLFFYFISFISGLSGIRYILYFLIPLGILYFWKQTKVFVEEKKQFKILSFFLENQKTKLSFISILLSGFGYITNALFLSKIYSYTDFSTQAFNTFGSIGLSRVFGDLLSLFGYQNDVSVITPAGLINILIYIVFVFFLICFIRSIITETNEKYKDFLFFTIIMIVFNCFAFINTEYSDRYLILPFIFLIPCTILLIKNQSINIIHRTLLIISFTFLTLTSAFLVYENILCGNENQNKEKISSFLKEKDYHYAYASFWNANVLTYLTDGKLEVASFAISENEAFHSFCVNSWLSPDRFYTDGFGNNEKIIFIVTKEEYNLNPTAKVFSNGTIIFKDDNYYIFEYMNNKTFKESF